LAYLVFILALVTAIAVLVKLLADRIGWLSGYSWRLAILVQVAGIICALVCFLNREASLDFEVTIPGMGADTTTYRSDRGVECSLDSLQQLILQVAGAVETEGVSRRLAREQAACLDKHISLPMESSIVAIGLGDLHEAVASLNRGLPDVDGNSPQAARIHFLLGVTQTLRGNDSLAITAYERTLTIRPDHTGAWYLRGFSLARLGRNEEAVASLDSSLARGRNRCDVWLLRARALTALDRPDEAIACYDRALALKGNLPLAWSNRGAILDRLGRYEEALHSYDSAIAYRRDFVAAWFNRSVALYNLGRTAEALAGCDSTLRYNPDLTRAKVLRRTIMQNAGN